MSYTKEFDEACWDNSPDGRYRPEKPLSFFFYDEAAKRKFISTLCSELSCRGRLPLHHYCRRGMANGMMWLIQNGQFEIDQTTHDYSTLLHTAAAANRPYCITALIPYVNAREISINARDDLGFTALDCAMGTSPACVKLLLQLGADATDIRERSSLPECRLIVSQHQKRSTIESVLTALGKSLGPLERFYDPAVSRVVANYL